ncbi:MAG: FAD-dependent oxidoreductase [Thermoleophilia bacterium]|nr:FAD-dependent oxidoreductase [Thermoleophilia bacterium]
MNAQPWPYPVRYGKETVLTADVLVIGGGIAGCHAAISATKRGAKVIVVDKGAIIRSGSGGAGVDHWGRAYTNPCSKITPDEAIMMPGGRGLIGPVPGAYSIKHVQYIIFNESWEAALDMEQWGMRIRDVDDEFVGAEFRDEETKLLFAYDYDTRTTLRVQGAHAKVYLYRQMKKLGITMLERVMGTSLLTEGGRGGGRVVGATAVNVRTGEFYVIRAKATILATGQPLRIWVFNTELAGSCTAHDDPNCAGDGCAMAWRAGAEFTLMERSMQSSGPFRYPAYGTGNASNTWYGCTIVDETGKEVPWVDSEGNVLKTVSERFHPKKRGELPRLIPDLADRIRAGEFVLPLYADLPGMPEHERRAIFGLMVAHEGKTLIPIYKTYTEAGFDPDRDMLQANVLPPEVMGSDPVWWAASAKGASAPQWRETAFGGGGGLVVDWDLKTTLEGLYAAGNQIAGYTGHPGAAATGRYAGRKAVEYLRDAPDPVVDARQVEQEKQRVYAPVTRKNGTGWKELQAGISRIMQDYCSYCKTESVLKKGLEWLESIEKSEAAKAYARNPHELWRTLETFVRLTVSEIILHASLARRASSEELDFWRIDYPQVDPPEWKKFVTVRLKEDEVEVGERPLEYWLKDPYLPSYAENYLIHSAP